jgi:hypothetical protein
MIFLTFESIQAEISTCLSAAHSIKTRQQKKPSLQHLPQLQSYKPRRRRLLLSKIALRDREISRVKIKDLKGNLSDRGNGIIARRKGKEGLNNKVSRGNRHRVSLKAKAHKIKTAIKIEIKTETIEIAGEDKTVNAALKGLNHHPLICSEIFY